ncbi:Flp pilus assembly protein CpaB [Rhodobacteraceae bacterium 2376]|uniref:Flp pilus assembly protein CpaB n=1 Tax=Rhabdonatronobacter sediminivivens TaxID=2743469 RepID=A0A7Z0I143_9RHOB|nr:Flp pilus assembly protein CpaB [Rhabdonatronobacter sediminivivens]NYS25682.1 Flp pilus assembly protein CpaB [Rhabdonatronobacter sediminivivens]
MRAVFGLVLLAGVALAGFAVYMTQDYISKTQAELAAARAGQGADVEMGELVLARRPLRYGEPLERDAVVVAPWPKFAIPEGAFTSVDELFPEGERERVVLRMMEPREAVMTSKISAPGADAGITSRLSRGMRAFTIQVNVTTGVSGFLRPGDHVDVFWTGRTGGGEITRLIQSQLRLIAVDQSSDMDRRSAVAVARNVTVEASPSQIAALAQAQSTGRLSLALVGLDDDSAEFAEIDQRRLLGIEEREETVVQEAEKCHVRTRRGGELVLIEIPCTN